MGFAAAMRQLMARTGLTAMLHSQPSVPTIASKPTQRCASLHSIWRSYCTGVLPTEGLASAVGSHAIGAKRWSGAPLTSLQLTALPRRHHLALHGSTTAHAASPIASGPQSMRLHWAARSWQHNTLSTSVNLLGSAQHQVIPAAALQGSPVKRSLRWFAAPLRRGCSSSAAGAAGSPGGEELAKARRLSLPVGVAAGLFGSCVGVGGGIIIVPVIANACRSIPQRMVSGTSIFAALSTALGAGWTYVDAGAIDPATCAIIALTASLTSPIGATLTTKFNSEVIKKFLGWFLLLASPLVPLKAYYMGQHPPAPGAEEGAVAPPAGAPAAATSMPVAGPGTKQQKPLANSPSEGTQFAAWAAERGLKFEMPSPASTVALGAIGGVVGLLSGMLGVGGGILLTTALAVGTDMPQVSVLGTALVAFLPPGVAAVVQHQRLGNIDWRMAGLLSLGTLAGGLAGSQMATNAPPGWLEAAFGIGMMFMGWKTLRGLRKVAVRL